MSWVNIVLLEQEALVNSNVKDFALVVGVPAKQIGWMSKFGEKLDLPVEGDGHDVCKHTGEKYSLKNGQLSVT